ncbi:competence protein CoiA [Metabacillus niabensis]|uniref:competence protein CoiA n=1 Tax=Metabacillus niabensis TaxID=324854 RepID=UPI001CFAC4B0|nr:competence protein CoiA family protein [Metabacillus niabensis]
MFVAIDQEGLMVNVAETKWSRTKLMKLREERIFNCPTCNQEVDLKIGSIIAAHFAHKKSGECPTVKGSLESDYHMRGKHDLYHWYTSQKGIESVQLEPYLQETMQRPDLFIKYNQKKIAIEYQCSTIDTRILRKRSQLYHQEGISYLWILGAKTLTRVASQSYRLSPFQWNFILKKENSAPYLFSYCPNSRAMIVLYHLLPFSSRTVISEHKHYPLPSSSLHDVMKLQPYKKENLYKEWIRKVRSFRLKAPGFQSKQSSKLHQYLYQTVHLPLPYLPSYAFLPLDNNYIFESPVYVWQGWILLFIHAIPLNGSFRTHDVYHAISIRMNDGSITSRSLIKHVSFTSAINTYLMKLADLGVVIFEEEERLKKKKEIRWTNQMEELLKEDVKIIGSI